jgi:hypothetical protein
MGRRVKQYAWILLATFLVGGVLGPVAHRIQHLASGSYSITDAAASIDHEAQGDCVQGSEGSEFGLEVGTCAICSAILSYVSPEPVLLLSIESVALLDRAFPDFSVSRFLPSNSGRSPPAAG